MQNELINALSSLVNGRVFTFTSTGTTSTMTSHILLIIAEYINAHVISVFLFAY